jgi:hypothetical protein
MFSILDPVRTREALDPVEKLTDWELFQSLASELILQISKLTLVMKLIKQHAFCSLYRFGIHTIYQKNYNFRPEV